MESPGPVNDIPRLFDGNEMCDSLDVLMFKRVSQPLN